MDWKKEKLQSIWKLNKEKLIFLFCSGLLLFILSMPNGDTKDSKETGNFSPQAAFSEITGGTYGGLSDGQEAEGQKMEGDGTMGVVRTTSSGSADSMDTYEAELEKRICAILAGVDGVGEVEVMVVLKSSEEKVLHVDTNTSVSTTEEKGEGGTSRIVRQQDLSEYTVMGSQSQTPIVEKELSPELSGIIISADGGGNAVVKTEISEAMEALFGLPAHKIKLLKRGKKGV